MLWGGVMWWCFAPTCYSQVPTTPEQAREFMLERIRDKDGRMNRRLRRHREQISERRWMVFRGVVLWLCGPPIMVAIVAETWRWCLWLITR